MKQGLLILGCLTLLTGCVFIPPAVYSPTDPKLLDTSIECDEFVTSSPEWRAIYRQSGGILGTSHAHEQMVRQCEQYRRLQYVKGGS